jgi:hypothetical protein
VALDELEGRAFDGGFGLAVAHEQQLDGTGRWLELDLAVHDGFGHGGEA